MLAPTPPPRQVPCHHFCPVLYVVLAVTGLEGECLTGMVVPQVTVAIAWLPVEGEKPLVGLRGIFQVAGPWL